MPDRDQIMGACISDLKEREEDPDITLLERIVEELMPGLEDAAERDIDPSDRDELLRIRDDFLKDRLGLDDDDKLMGAIQKTLREYGRKDEPRMRPVLYYMLVKEFGKEDAFDA